MTNTNDAPVIRLGEILLNWIEARAEWATLGGPAVEQGDIDRSINALRRRPLDATAVANGVTRTADMLLAALPDDPARIAPIETAHGGSVVEPLIWEIRRERRMELYMELPRLLDLKRWRRIHYMRGSENPDILRGIWVDMPNEFPRLLTLTATGAVPNRRVQRADGTIVTFTATVENGVITASNAADMVGYLVPFNVGDRPAFDNQRAYLSFVGLDQITLYESQGFRLTQTEAWR